MMRENFTAVRVAGALLVSAGTLTASGEPQPEYTLFAPIPGTTASLIDLSGATIHQWPSAYHPGQAVYLLDQGDLFYTANDPSIPGFQAGGRGGRLQRFAWDGTLQWNYQLGSATSCQHHDAIILPNGNALAIVWETKTRAQAIAAGRNPATVTVAGLWADSLVEIRPNGATGGDIVWEWHAWDHLVQNFDAAKPNFAQPNARPDRININYSWTAAQTDWLHCNGLDYNAALDQIIVSAHNMSEIWIISHAPGASGDLLYRWGNPAACGMGTAADQKLFGQHNPNWIRDGLPGAGHILLFNNGLNRPAGAYSSIEEIQPPLLTDGTYSRAAGQPFGPTAATWSCDAADGVRFYSSIISSAQRLPNGNTLMCLGSSGRFMELDSLFHSVWSFTVPTIPGGGNSTFRATRITARDSRLDGLLWCLADYNADGGIDGTDVDSFFAAWSLGDAAADVNEDGGVDGGDVAAFFARWESGC